MTANFYWTAAIPSAKLCPMQDRFDQLYRKLFWLIISVAIIAVAALFLQSLRSDELRNSLPKLAKFGAFLALPWVLSKLFPELRTRVRRWHVERPFLIFLLNFTFVVASVFVANLIFGWPMLTKEIAVALLGAILEAFLAAYVFVQKPKDADGYSQGIGTIDNKPIV